MTDLDKLTERFAQLEGTVAELAKRAEPVPEPTSEPAPQPTPASETPAIDVLTGAVNKLTEAVAKQGAELADIRKLHPLGNALSVGGSRSDDQDDSWPIDMNADKRSKRNRPTSR